MGQVAPGRTFPAKLTAFEQPSRLEFSRGTPLGQFRGVRTYSPSPEGEDVTAFHMRESGGCAP